MTINQKLINFIKDEEGLTMVEYAVAGAVVTAVAATAFILLGNNIGSRITNLAGVVGSPAA